MENCVICSDDGGQCFQCSSEYTILDNTCELRAGIQLTDIEIVGNDSRNQY